MSSTKTPASNASSNSDAAQATDKKKTRKASGPRKPGPLYLFARVDDTGKIVVNKATKNAKDIATWAANGGFTDPNNQLLTIDLGAVSEAPTAKPDPQDPSTATA